LAQAATLDWQLWHRISSTTPSHPTWLSQPDAPAMTRKSSKANGGQAPKEKRSKEPEVERFRSLEELNAAFSKGRTIGFRSLGELSKEYQHQQQPVQEASKDIQSQLAKPDVEQASKNCGTGVLKKIFEGRGFGFITPDQDHGAGDIFLHFSDITGAGARSLVVGTWVRYDVEPDTTSGRLRAKNVSIIQAAHWSPGTPSTTASESPSIQVPPIPEGTRMLPLRTESYNRDIMLGVFKALATSRRLETVSSLKLSTVHVPKPERRGADEEDPCLDDERLLARLEARLDKECGADALNMQTFGTSSGWSFEEAVAANEKLRLTSREEDSTTAGGSLDDGREVSERGEESDASDIRKETRQETPGVDEEAYRMWSWESSSGKSKLLEDHRQAWEEEQWQMEQWQMALSAPAAFQ